jgi:sugar/nucleoside kinase (ribokinase family)
MSGALDWLAVGDAAEERTADGLAILGGGAARLTAHAAALGLRTALVAKLGEDDEGRQLRDALERLKVDLRWLRIVPGMRTTVWHQPDGQVPERRVDRGADLALRLDELPPISVTAPLTVVSGYSLSVEPARSAALGALTMAQARTGNAALLLEADLLWWTNARMTRRVLEPTLDAADSVAMTTADAHALFGPVDAREALRLMAEMGPRLVYLAQPDGSVLLRDASRVYAYPSDAVPRDRYAGPAAFWAGLAQKSAPRKAALDAVRYASSVRRAGAPRPPHASAATVKSTRL